MSLSEKTSYRAALTSLSIWGALACPLALVGCLGTGDDTASPPPIDAGHDGRAGDATSGDDAAADGGASDATTQDAQDGGPTSPATASLSAAAIDFGLVGCGTTTASENLTITNTGGAALVISATIVGAAFSLIGPSTLTLAAGASGMLTLNAAVPASATAATPITGSLALFTNDPSGPDRVLPLSVTPSGATLGGTALYVFPATPIGVASSALPVMLTNTGNATATFSIGAPTTPTVAVNGVPSAGITLKAGASFYGTTTFTPTGPSTFLGQAALAATSGVTCGSSIPNLLFNGQGSNATLSGWPSNNAIDFGLARCGGAAPAPQTITLANGSTNVVAHVTSVDTSVSDGFGVSVVAGDTIAAGGTLPITVTPPAVSANSSLAAISGTVVLHTDAAPSTLTLTMTEEPQGAVLKFNQPANFGSFGTVILLQSASETFSVTNTGNAPAEVTLIAAENGTGGASEEDGGAEAGLDATAPVDGGGLAPFTLSTPSFTITGNGTQSESVTFEPLHANATVGTLALEVDPSQICGVLPKALPLSGSAIGGGPDITPMSLAFGATCGGSAPAAQTLLVINDGTVDLNWTMSGLSGPGKNEFSVTSSPAPGLLIPGAFATVTVHAAAVPSPAPNPNPATGTAQVTINTDVPFDPPHVITLSEVPLGDQLSVSAGNLRFGQVPLNTALSQGFTITNNANPGSPAATVLLAASGPYSVQSGGTIAAGMSVTEMVRFDATSGGAYPSALAFMTSDALCTPLPAPIILSGSGTTGALSLSSTTLTFGTSPSDPAGLVNCGATGTPNSVSLSNLGTQTLNILTATLGKGSSSPFTLSGPAATLPLSLVIGGSSSLTITPSAIPQSVANPNDPSAYSDVLTITTDAPNDTPHAVTLTMQPYGAVIASSPLQTAWTFGMIGAGAIGTFTNTIQNSGNAPASATLTGLLLPQVFGLTNNPTTVAPNAVTTLVGQFTPQSQNGIWSDQGQLVVTASAFCQALPAQWVMPTVNLSGTSNANPVVSFSGSLTFPTTNCGSAAPAAQAITLTNLTNQVYPFTVRFGSGTFYSGALGTGAHDGGVADAGVFGMSPDGGASMADGGPGIGSGTLAASGVAVIDVIPRTLTPGQGVMAGSASYADDLLIDIASTPVTSYTIPISWGLNGAVFSLPSGLGTNTDPSNHLFYPADTQSGFTLPMDNTGTGTATVSFGMQPSGAFSFSPASPITVEPGIRAYPVLSSAGSDATCPTLTTGSVTFLYSGPVCQPFAITQVSIESCVGTY